MGFFFNRRAKNNKMKDEKHSLRTTTSRVEPGDDTITAQQAIDEITERTYVICTSKWLTEKDGSIRFINEINHQQDFSQKVYAYCRKKHSASDKIEIATQSIKLAFYGSAYITFGYFNMPGSKINDPFEVLCSHFIIDNIEDYSTIITSECDEKYALIAGRIYRSLLVFARETLRKVRPVSEQDIVIVDTIENAYALGMLFAKKVHEQQERKNNPTLLEQSLKRLRESVGDYLPQRSQPSHVNRRIPDLVDVTFSYKCCKCGSLKQITTRTWDNGEPILSTIKKYDELASEYSAMGYPASFQMLCASCMRKYYTFDKHYLQEGRVFVVKRPPYNEPFASFPMAWNLVEEQYEIALSFIKGADTIKDLAAPLNEKLPWDRNADDLLKAVYTVLGEDDLMFGGEHRDS